MPISASDLERAVMQELRVDVTSMLADRPNWKLDWRSDGLWRFGFSSTNYTRVNIGISLAGTLVGQWRDSRYKNEQHFYLGNLSCSDVFATASVRLLEQVWRHALPFLDPSLDDFRVARLLLFKSMMLVEQWRQLDTAQLAWLESIVQCAREQLTANQDLRTDRWLSLLSTATHLFHHRKLTCWPAEDRERLQCLFKSIRYRMWFRNRFEELVDGTCGEAKDKWPSSIELQQVDWFLKQADLQTLLLAGHLL
jgi:hypothetical protein